jgi:hypothetical protein
MNLKTKKYQERDKTMNYPNVVFRSSFNLWGLHSEKENYGKNSISFRKNVLELVKKRTEF